MVALKAGVFDPRVDSLYRQFLQPANYSRLRGLRLELADLYAPWTEMLLAANRVPEALELVDTAVLLDARNRKCLDIKARALLRLSRGEEARAVLRGLTLDTPRVRLAAGMAEEQTGNLEGAWSHYSALLEDTSNPAAESARGQLRLRAATVLNGLGRAREAVGLLAELLVDDPDDVPALNQLVVSTRSLERREATRALNERVRHLMHRQSLLETGRKASSANVRGSVFYYEALAAAEVHRLGSALVHLDRGTAADPGLSPLYHERARIRLLLCRYRAAEFELRRGSESTDSPALLADLARVQGLRGHREEMSRTIARVEALRAEVRASDRDRERESTLDLKLARACLESRDYARVGALLKGTSASDVAMAENDLCLAELAWREGRVDESRELLTGNFQILPGGEAWARALRALLAGSRDTLEDDPSDVLDHPRLFLGEAPPFRSGETGGASLAFLRDLHARRLEIVARMEGYSDRAAASGWKELLDLYREAGAGRKAREVAWFLVHLYPTDVNARQQLARILSAEEEAVVRFAVLREAARLSPRGAPVRRELAEVSEFLGLNDHEFPSK